MHGPMCLCVCVCVCAYMCVWRKIRKEREEERQSVGKWFCKWYCSFTFRGRTDLSSLHWPKNTYWFSYRLRTKILFLRRFWSFLQQKREVLKDEFLIVTTQGRGVSGIWWKEILLNSLQCTGHPLPQNDLSHIWETLTQRNLDGVLIVKILKNSELRWKTDQV